MKALILVGLGGAIGAIFRYTVTQYLITERFPLATLTVNVLGSLLIGIAYVLIVERMVVSHDLKYLLIAGFLGAFTTFSTFSLDTIKLIEAGQLAMAGTYIASSLVACCLATWLGVVLCRAAL